MAADPEEVAGLTEGLAPEAPAGSAAAAGGRRPWRRAVALAAAAVAAAALVAVAMTRTGGAFLSKAQDFHPLVLTQDLRMLGEGHYLAWSSGKSKSTNAQLAFNHFLETSGMKHELSSSERAVYWRNFKAKIDELSKRTDHPTRQQWRRWLEDALEDEKPEITAALAHRINSGGRGFKVSVEPWMGNVTFSDFRVRLGAVQPPGPPPQAPPSPPMSARAPKEFHTYEKWPQCADVIRRDHNQGACGSCWAFAANSVIDSRLCIKTGGSFKGERGMLSRTYATACARRDASGNSIDGCQGGWGHEVFNLAASHGIPTGGSEGCLPYFAHGEGIDHFDNQQVAPPCPGQCIKAGYPRLLHADKFKFGKITDGWYYSQSRSERAKSERVRAVQQALITDGPVIAYVHCDNAFFAYREGIYNSACDQDYANHAVTAIGFGGNDCPRGYANCPGYFWSLLNSWGGQWGNGGEMKVAPCVTTSFDIPPPITSSDKDAFPSPMFPDGSSPSPSPSGDPFEVSAPCSLNADKCAVSPGYDPDSSAKYGNKQACTIKVKRPEGVKLLVADFVTEAGYDFLTVNGRKYSGSSSPAEVVAKGEITWTSDYSVTKTGWMICEEPSVDPDHELTCDNAGDDVAKPKGEKTTVKCPDGCAYRRRVWGSNPYTSDSGLCNAATHAGLSGTITVEFKGTLSNYKGTHKNGIHSSPWSGNWNGMKLS